MKKKKSFDLPCYTKPDVQEDFRKKIRKKCYQWRPCNEDTEIVKILAPLTDNPNAGDNDGKTPIYWAAKNGRTEIVKILAPLTDHPKS